MRVPGVGAGGASIEVRFAQPLPARTRIPARTDPAAPGTGAAEGAPRTPVLVHGRLTLGGRAPGDWTVGWGGLASTPLDAQGAFWLRGTLERHAALHFLRPGGQEFRALRVPVELHAGEQEWSLDLAVGALALFGLPEAPPGSEDGARLDFVLEQRSEGRAWSAAFARPASRGLTLGEVPAGRVALRARPEGNHEDPSSWPLLTEVEVVAGATRAVGL